MLNSKKTVADVIAIVNYAVGKMRRHWNLTETEIDDLRQDGYLAAIQADKSYDERKAAWSTWVLTRVNGQLKTSIERLRSFGITAVNSNHPKRLLDVTNPLIERNSDDEDNLENSIEEFVPSEEVATDEAADTSSMVQSLLSCVSPRSKHILCLYYGLSGNSPSLSTTQLAAKLGYSKKHAFTLLQQAQQEAKTCIGAGVRSA